MARAKVVAKKSKSKPKPKAKPAPRLAKAKGSIPRLLDMWTDLRDRDALRVWADALADAGDPRGEYVQLCLVDDPTDEQWQARSRLLKQQGALVGPAREYLRTWLFDEHGLVIAVTCEAQRFIAGFDAICELHPQLHVSVTSLRKQTKATIAKLAKLPLDRVYCLSLGSNALDDAGLEALAPALAKVRHLCLEGNNLSGAGFVALGKHVQQLEALQLGVHVRDESGQPLADALIDAILATPGFRTLRAVAVDSRYLPDAKRIAALKKLPHMTTVQIGRFEVEFDGIERLKRAS